MKIEEGRIPIEEGQEAQTVKRRPMQPQAISDKSGWDPVIVLLVGALIVSIILSFYGLSEAASARAALKSVSSATNGRATEFAQNLASQKRRIEELDLYKAKAEEREKLQAREVKTLQDELTKTKHTLHEQETRARRLHRDNVELHKKLQVKSSELKMLEDQTHTFEAEMGKLTKSIHTIQSGVQQEAESTTDYELLFKKQQEQRDRMEAESTNAVTNAVAKTSAVEGVHLSKTDVLSKKPVQHKVEVKEHVKRADRKLEKVNAV